MERNANYALVGLAVTGLFLGLVLFIIWLARVGGEQPQEYDIAFRGPVTGLAEGAAVVFNGLNVGQVTELELDENDPNQVNVRISIDRDTPVREAAFGRELPPEQDGSVAQLEPNIITGVTTIGIRAGNPARPKLLERWNEAQRRGRREAMDRVKIEGLRPAPDIKSAQNALGNLVSTMPEMVRKVQTSLDNVNQLLSEENVAVLSATMRDVNAVTAELNANRALIRETRLAILQARTALQTIDGTADEITRLANDSRNLVNCDAKRALADVAETAQEIKASAAQVRASIDQIAEPTAEFARTGLPQITASVVQLQSAAESVERLTNEINRSPTGLLSRGRAREVEVAR
jgi:phospholipid/cholesterol/gamma-HCH transport system substrate-binding protein